MNKYEDELILNTYHALANLIGETSRTKFKTIKDGAEINNEILEDVEKVIDDYRNSILKHLSKYCEEE